MLIINPDMIWGVASWACSYSPPHSIFMPAGNKFDLILGVKTLLEESGDNLVFLANTSKAYTNDVNMDSKILQKYSWLDDFQNPVTS